MIPYVRDRREILLYEAEEGGASSRAERMTLAEIEALAAAGESETLELKASTGERVAGAMTVCAMLNHRGGTVLFGVQPNRRVSGQKVGDRTIEQLSSALSEIDPPAFPTVDQAPVQGDLRVVVVTVSAGQHQPYTHRGRALRRVGNTNRTMSRDEYHRVLLERLHGQYRWENEPVTEWAVDDLDPSEITRTVDEAIRRRRAEEPGTRDPTELLRGLGLIRGDRLLRAAVVLFGRSERVGAEYPQCMLRVARFRGAARTDEFLDNRQFRGNAFELLTRAERFFQENLPIAGRIEPDRFERVDDPLYPPEALREALANAICHRDYSIGGGSVAAAIYNDRLEVTSSGSLHFGLTVEALFKPHESLPWNPLIAQVFYRRGIIEQWGRGTIKMRELVTSAGLPAPEIEDAGGCVTVRFRPGTYVPTRVEREVSDRQRAILALLVGADEGYALREIVSGLDESATSRQVREDLWILRTLGLAECRGRGRGARWKRR